MVQEHFHSFAREQAGANKRKYAGRVVQFETAWD